MLLGETIHYSPNCSLNYTNMCVNLSLVRLQNARPQVGHRKALLLRDVEVVFSNTCEEHMFPLFQRGSKGVLWRRGLFYFQGTEPFQ